MYLSENRDAEMALLFSVIYDADHMSEVTQIVQPADFFYPQLRDIAHTVWKLYERNEAIDFVSVPEQMIKEKKLGAEPQDKTVFFDLELATPDTSNAKQYAIIVRDKAIGRALIRSCHNILNKIPTDMSIEEMLDYAEKTIFEITQRLITGEQVPVSKIVPEIVDEVNRAMESQTGLLTGIKTEFPDIDHITAGLQPGELIILAGRPSQGKTTLALNFARRINVPVGIFSLESSRHQIVRNLISAQGKIDTYKLRSGFMSRQECGMFVIAAGEVSEMPIVIDDYWGLTPLILRGKARRMMSQYKVGLIIVDYLQLLTTDEKRERREQEVAFISHQLKALAKELNIPILAISQLNRASEMRRDNEPKLSDLRESGVIEQDADVVLMLWRKNLVEKITILKVEKNRNGRTGIVKLFFNSSFLRFESIEKGDICDETGNVPIGKSEAERDGGASQSRKYRDYDKRTGEPNKDLEVGIGGKQETLPMKLTSPPSGIEKNGCRVSGSDSIPGPAPADRSRNGCSGGQADLLERLKEPLKNNKDELKEMTEEDWADLEAEQRSNGIETIETIEPPPAAPELESPGDDEIPF